jgi:hypothetical protein
LAISPIISSAPSWSDAGITYEPPPAALAEHFSQKQVAEIAASVIKMNLRTRLKLAQGAVAVAE